ncbi:quinone-dependent dihydroorotate dehydrogenase [Deinococcus peraridilitoris]|uniref:Dihydroorotate dehydrogenase (quinone) n=1 Tax=Deinococcus peraridilitoris (strain DSM 19664 / LMG 22246 / CIP 109416 / KR-200) TaxID=937777 RepID=L0A4T8_DEIPD|nr:quinone-dependent dihydroorotate dehydrogenase [Deinococcus peraridilitoris]AFZ68898.1 dihydroorotate dehydrogenase, subfamily 2 [Deinococcus peraridilitoris DSM 19664]
MPYRRLLKPLLFRLDAENAHHLTLRGLSSAQRLSAGRALLAALYAVPASKRLESHLWDLRFPSPVGLAAGLDKNAQAVDALSRIGLGFLEVGTVTPRPQAGNERPRLFRLPEDKALINRMGFNNEGAQAMARRLAAFVCHPVPVGVNIGKNKDTPNEQAAEDYRECLRELYAYGDFFVVNVSSPNTPGLRSLQGGGELLGLLRAVLQEADVQRVRQLQHKPVLVKIAPDLDDDALQTTVNAVRAAGVQGIIVSNTTLSREGLSSPHRQQAGGLSGQPLRERSTALVRRVYALTQGALPIVASGGVFSAQDAYEKIRAGASLVEIYTALIYEGPEVLRSINEGLEALLQRNGFDNVAQAVGADHR